MSNVWMRVRHTRGIEGEREKGRDKRERGGEGEREGEREREREGEREGERDLKNCVLPLLKQSRIVSRVLAEGFSPDCCIAWYMVISWGASNAKHE